MLTKQAPISSPSISSNASKVDCNGNDGGKPGNRKPPAPSQSKRYGEQLASHLHLVQPVDNPYRNTRTEMHPGVNLDGRTAGGWGSSEARAYNNDVSVKKAGSYTAVVANLTLPPHSYSEDRYQDDTGALSKSKSNNSKRRGAGEARDKGSTVTKEAVVRCLSQLAKTSVQAYDMRIVETGALLRALQDVRLAAPGVASVVLLHRAFVDAACMNPNPWMLNRHQVAEVIENLTPWLPKSVAFRLFSAYDPHRSGPK